MPFGRLDLNTIETHAGGIGAASWQGTAKRVDQELFESRASRLAHDFDEILLCDRAI